jgi:cell division protease FtsH
MTKSRRNPARQNRRARRKSVRLSRKDGRPEATPATVEPGIPVNEPAVSPAIERLCDDLQIVRSLELEHRMAVHEAGHAVARLHLDIGTIVKITIEAPEGGYVAGTMPGPGEQTEEMLTGVLIAGLAGRAAEEVIVGTVVAGSGSEGSDLATATALACEMETTMGFSRRWPLLHRKVEDRGAIFAVDHDLAERVHARLASALVVARKMAVEHEATIDFLGDILMRRKTLEGEELEAVLEQVRHRLAAPPG